MWIVRYEGERPEAWRGVPVGAIAIEPAEPGTLTARQARRYVKAFHRAIQDNSLKIGVVALPVEIRYVGDPQPGEAITAV